MSFPKPNVEFASEDVKPEEMTEAQMKGLMCNPTYAGLGPFSAIITDDQWIMAALSIIKDEGPTQFLVNMLYVLRQTFSGTYFEYEDERRGNHENN